MKTGIIGGAGYTAGELIRLLIRHPEVELAWVQSRSQLGKRLDEVHTDLVGESELRFTQEDLDEVEAIFLCLGHGQARAWMEAHPQANDLIVIDLSQDYRIEGDHDFIYGLPELNREGIRQGRHIANPGCFATALQLALLPLAAAGELGQEVHIHALTGSTGAGVQPSDTTHFSWRDNNLSVYKAFSHQHLAEIGQSLRQLQPGFTGELNFLPLRGNFSRGIFASSYLNTHLSQDAAQALYHQYYESHPFVHLVPSNPHLKQVVNTNKCLIHLEKHGDKLLIISMIDNLLKGASGQALQNLNLIMGWEETMGLRLKPGAF